MEFYRDAETGHVNDVQFKVFMTIFSCAKMTKVL